MSDWPKDKLPSPGKPLTEAQLALWNAEVDVVVEEIEARVGPHPASPEYQVWLKHEAERAGSKT
jgi:hypothetical protein